MNIDVNNDSNNGAEIKRFHVGESNDDIIVSGFPSNQLNLTLKDPLIPESCIEIKIKLNFHFHSSFWCLKRFYEGL